MKLTTTYHGDHLILDILDTARDGELLVCFGDHAPPVQAHLNLKEAVALREELDYHIVRLRQHAEAARVRALPARERAARVLDLLIQAQRPHDLTITAVCDAVGTDDDNGDMLADLRHLAAQLRGTLAPTVEIPAGFEPMADREMRDWADSECRDHDPDSIGFGRGMTLHLLLNMAGGRRA